MKTRLSGKDITFSIILALLYLGILFVFLFWTEPILRLQETVGVRGGFVAPIAFISLAFLSVVLAPLTIAPIIPVASVVFGSFLAGTYSIIGWTLGSITAFFIARHIGKPILKKFVSLERVKEYESYIPEKMEFWAILLLRVAVPVDVVSYALGLFSSVKTWKYALASFFAFLPFAFVFAYVGGALIYKDLTLLLSLIGVSLVLFLVVAYIFYHHDGLREKLKMRAKKEDEK